MKKLTREDIQKYGTKDEIKKLMEYYDGYDFIPGKDPDKDLVFQEPKSSEFDVFVVVHKTLQGGPIGVFTSEEKAQKEVDAHGKDNIHFRILPMKLNKRYGGWG